MSGIRYRLPVFEVKEKNQRFGTYVPSDVINRSKSIDFTIKCFRLLVLSKARTRCDDSIKIILQIIWGSAVAWWLMPRTPDREVGGSSPTWVKLCCVLEQGTFTPQKYW